ncbi:helix-turn-helix domain-containing protein [Mesonia sp. MT50]|uniref:Helix-turn-helix domain-containing protein n=1 Tax=Mesonia profundi TaxID=3070998 RepID=A0ABU1A0C7_9FLAO|nr:helix-turn-helix domain-containing protein [Mesonia profundi]MDQ7917153.1 helix-turn-helix domain-containing protein [Mesonia profundi]
MEDQFLTCQPAPALAPYIAYYYVHQSFSSHFHKTFTYYPHFKHALTAYQQSSHCLLDEVTAKVLPDVDASPIVYSKLQTRIGTVHLHGVFQKVGIVFQPLGIHHFIHGNYTDLFPNHVNYVSCFGRNFEKVLDLVFTAEEIEEKSTLLNSYFLERQTEFPEVRLKKALQRIIESEGMIAVQDLAEELEVSRKTLLRLFQKHLDCSVEGYKKLIKFRLALKKIQEQKDVNLTQISSENYFDQSDFIKQFKKLTQLPPKKFLAAVTKMGSEDTIWNFKD